VKKRHVFFRTVIKFFNFMSTTLSPPIKRPSLALLSTEPWRAVTEYLAHKLLSDARLPKGDGHPVLIFPGLGADERSIEPLRKMCESLGYTAFDWGKGYNTGPKGNIDLWIQELATYSKQLLKNHDQTATLIGWSLGGIYARELAKLLKGRVRQVITIGTPFNAQADCTNVGWLYHILSRQSPVLDEDLKDQLRTAPPVPTTSIYSRTDGVVAWQSCVHDTSHAQVQDIEIKGSHIGMGWNPSALRIVADRLAQQPGNWRPFVAS
jgi:hypothetical protein